MHSLDGRSAKLHRVKGKFVHRGAAAGMMARLVRWEAKAGAEAVYTLDASAGSVRMVGNDGKAREISRCGWAAVRHDGERVAGGWSGDWGRCNNYFGELAAQIGAARAAAAAGIRRYVVVFDATSPVDALLTFIWANPRRRQRILGADWLDAWWRALQDFEVVVMLHQKSHVAEPVNDWADVEADAARTDLALDAWPGDVSRPSYSAGCVVGAERGARKWCRVRLREEAMVRLRGESRAQARGDEDMALRLPTSVDELAARLLCGRCQDGDPKRYFGGVMGRWAEGLRCPFGCQTGGERARFTWWHVQFRCEGRDMAEARETWKLRLREAASAAADAQRGVPLRDLRLALQACDDRGEWEAGLEYAGSKEVELRRIVGGCVRKLARGSSGAGGVEALVRKAVVAGLALQKAGQEATREPREAAQAEAERARKAKRWVARWKAAVFRGGPRRASELLEADRARERVAGLISCALRSGEFTEARAAEASGAMTASIKKEIAAARQQEAPSWYGARQLWYWLALVRKWRARSFSRAARRSTGGEEFAVGVPEGEVVGRVAAAAGVLPLAAGEWRWETYSDEARLPEGEGGALLVGAGVGTRAVMSRRRLRWGGSAATLWRLRGWDVVEGRAESSNGRWAVESLVSVRRPTVRRGRQLEVTVRWAGVNPLFGCPWGDSTVAITDLTPDLRKQARMMESAVYTEAPTIRPPPLRIQGKRGRGEDSGFLGSRWADDTGGS